MTPIVVFSGRARSGKDSAAKFLCEEYKGVSLAFADPIKRFLMAGFGLTEAQLWGDEKETEVEVFRRSYDMVGTLQGVVGQQFKQSDTNAFFARINAWLQEYVPAFKGKTTPRRLMQTFGTEVVRAVMPDLWLEVGLRDAGRILQGGMTYLRTEGVVPVGEAKSFCYNLVCITDGRFRNELLGVKVMGGLCVRIERPTENGLSADAKGHASEVEQSSIPYWWYDSVVHNDHALEGLEQQMRYFGGVRFGPLEAPR